MIIYLILNLLNGKMYIGKSIDGDIVSSQSRPYLHLHGNGSERVFSAVKCHGIENFMVIVIHKEDCTDEKLNDLEKYYIKHLNSKHPNGYNLTDGGDGNNGQTEETRNKLSISQKIAQNRPETKAKKSKSEKIAHNKPEVKKKASDKAKLDWADPEYVKKTLAAQSSPETKKKHQDYWNNKSDEEKINYGGFGRHIRWHWNRGIINVDCEHCIAQIMKEHS
jgi:group I intron endonuclease